MRLPCEFASSITVTVQDHKPLVASDLQGLTLRSDKLVGLTVNVGGGVLGNEQVHVTVSGLTPPEPVKVKVSF